MPKHGQLLAVALLRFVGVGEPDEVENEGVDDFVGECVFLVHEDADEEGVWT